jgi:hypothetical protein
MRWPLLLLALLSSARAYAGVADLTATRIDAAGHSTTVTSTTCSFERTYDRITVRAEVVTVSGTGELVIDATAGAALTSNAITYTESNGFHPQQSTGVITATGPARMGFDLTLTDRGTTVRLVGEVVARTPITDPGTGVVPLPAPDPDPFPDIDIAVDPTPDAPDIDTSVVPEPVSDAPGPSCDDSSTADDDAQGCESSADAGTIARIGHTRRRAPLGDRIFAWLLPYVAVGVFIRLWRRRLAHASTSHIAK